MITPGFLLNEARYNNSQSPYMYDPNMAVDPSSAMQLQQQYLKQQFAMQNPRMALPQQFGAALGNAIQGNGGGSQIPQGQQQGPKTPQAQYLEQQRQQYIKGGMDPGRALYKAATDLETSPQFQGDPMTSQIAEHARDFAIAKGKYDPSQDAKFAHEEQMAAAQNFISPEGAKLAAKPGSDMEKQLLASGWQRAGETPQIPVGERKQQLSNGKYQEVQWDGKKWNKVSSSSSPMQYQVSGTPEQMASGGLLGGTGTTAGADKVRKELADREIATTNAVRGIDSTTDTIKSSGGAAVGTAGDWYEHGNNIVQTARNLAGSFGQEDLMDPKTYNWQGLDTVVQKVRGKAIDATKYHAQMVATAYMMAAAQSGNNTDEKMTKQRISANLEMLAEHSDDPKAILGTLNTTRQQLVDNFKTQVKVYQPGYDSSALDQYEQSRKNPSNQYTSPEDIKAAYKAGKLTRDQAKQALKAHGYE